MHSDPYVQYACRYALTARADDDVTVHPSASGDNCLTTVRNGTYDKLRSFHRPASYRLGDRRDQRPRSMSKCGCAWNL